MRIVFNSLLMAALLFTQACWGQDAIYNQVSILARDPIWIKLGHYKKDSSTISGWRSAIHSEDFFIDKNGRDSPESELRATLAALNNASTNDLDKSPQCRFPARLKWLRTKIKNEEWAAYSTNCPEFEKWSHHGNVGSISLILATGYLGNPASYYGHTLLKFNYNDELNGSRLLDTSVNYGAITGKEDNVVEYIYKSITGGYDGGFTHINYYFHTHNYGDNQLRDLWEYKVELPQHEVDFIVAHAWEVLGKRYTYHFFRENCAYRMAELLQIVDGVNVTPNHWPWIIPQAFIKQLTESNYLGKPLVSEITYLPSRQSRFYARYSELDDNLKNTISDLVARPEDLEKDHFKSLSVESKQVVLDALMDYYQYIGAPIELAPSDLKKNYSKALSKRYELPPGETSLVVPEPESPHLSRNFGWVQLGLNRDEDRGSEAIFRIRSAYYDPLDSDGGQVKYSSLVMGDAIIGLTDSDIFLKKLEIVGVDSAHPGMTGLSGDKTLAWKVHFGLDGQRPSCEKCLVGRLNGSVGIGRSLSEKMYGGLYIGGAVQNNRDDYGVGYSTISGNLIFRGSLVGLLASYERRLPINSSVGPYIIAEVESRFSINKSYDLRVKYINDDHSQVQVAFGAYW